jgi:hypothetical protein
MRGLEGENNLKKGGLEFWGVGESGRLMLATLR